MGLADTNSTLMRRATGAWTRPHASGASRIRATRSSSAASASRRLRKPGSATSTLPMTESPATEPPGGRGAGDGRARSDAFRTDAPPADAPVAAPAASSAASASAIVRGGMRQGRASLIARLLARSPCSGLAGRSTSTSGLSAAASAGSAPLASARAHASSIAARTRDRSEGTAGLGSGAGAWLMAPPSWAWLAGDEGRRAGARAGPWYRTARRPSAALAECRTAGGLPDPRRAPRARSTGALHGRAPPPLRSVTGAPGVRRRPASTGRRLPPWQDAS